MRKIITLVCITLIFSLKGWSQNTMSFQGKLIEDGVPGSGIKQFVFSIPSLNPAWTETHALDVVDGLYSVTMGSITPLPQLFDGVGDRELQISVDGNALTPVTLTAPYQNRIFNFTANDQPGDANGQPVGYLYNIESNDAGIFRGLQLDVNGTGQKYGLRSNVASATGDGTWKVGLFGSSSGDGSGDHTGVYAQAFGTGQFNDGVRGVAGGAGNGTNDTANSGVSGDGSNNPHANNGGHFKASGSVGTFNFGVQALSQVNDGSLTIENTGVFGNATGSGINRGIHGTASGGDENWAGWFDGNLAVNNGLIGSWDPTAPHGQTGEPGDWRLLAGSNFFDDQSNGLLMVFGPRDDGEGRRAMLGSYGDLSANSYGQLELAGYQGATKAILTSEGQAGKLQLWNDSDIETIRLDANSNIGLSMGGALYSWGTLPPNGTPPTWVGTQANSGFMQLVGYDGGVNVTGALLTGFFGGDSNPQVYMEDENATRLVHMRVQDDGNGNKEGVLELLRTDGTSFVMGPDGLGSNSEFQNLGIRNGADDRNVIYMANHGTNNNVGFMSFSGSDDHGRLDLNVNDDGTGNEWGSLRLGSATTFNGTCDDDGDPNTPEVPCEYNQSMVEMGAKQWETTDTNNPNPGGENRPYMVLRGEAQQDMIWMDVTKDIGTGEEFGTLTLRSTDGSEFSLDANGLQNPEFNHININATRLTNNNPAVDISVHEWGDDTNTPETEPDIDVPHITLTGSDGKTLNMNSFGLDLGGSRFPNNNPLITMNIHEWGDDPNSPEIEPDIDVPHLTLRGSDGSEFSINSYGINSPLENLDVNNSINTNSINLTGDLNGSGNQMVLTACCVNGTSDEFNIVEILNGQNLGSGQGEIKLRGNDGNVGVMMGGFGDINASGEITGGIGTFGDAFDNGVLINHNSPSLKMHSGGNGGISDDGTETVSIDGDNGHIIVTGDITSFSAGISQITTDDLLVNNSFTNNSDARLKENVASISNALEKTSQLRGVTYNWNDVAAEKKGVKKGEEKIGVIAQEVEKVLPVLVKTHEDGFKSVDYISMVAVLIESIKELNAKITALESENSDLKASLEIAEANSKSIETLTTQLNTLQQLINNLAIQPHQDDDDIAITEQK